MVFADKILKGYCVTEKATELSSNFNKYIFEVYNGVNRIEVAKSVESLFNVKVSKVNILNKKGKTKRSRTQRGKQGKTSSSKRAIVTLVAGDKIELI